MHQEPTRQSTALRAGFTIFELLIVMVIAAIVATIVVPSINYTNMRVSSSARQIDMAMLSAQRLAVLRQYSVVVAFDTVQRQVRVHEDSNSNGAMDTNERLTYHQLEDGVVFGRGGAPAYTIGASGISFVKRQAGVPAVTFTRSGSAGEMGGLYLTSQRAATTGAFAPETRAITVNRGTGRVTLHTYTGSEWKRSF